MPRTLLRRCTLPSCCRPRESKSRGARSPSTAKTCGFHRLTRGGCELSFLVKALAKTRGGNMKVSYKGIKQELPVRLQTKLDAKFAKLSKLLEKRGELEAHVVVATVRHLHKAEVTIQFYDHQLVGIGSDADLFTGLSEALDKLETQAVKNRGKWQERRKDGSAKEAEAPLKSAKGQSAKGQTDKAKSDKAQSDKAKR